MPSINFFRKQGLFITEEFFEPAFCAQLRLEMLTAPAKNGLIDDHEHYGILDQTVRKVLLVKPENATRVLVKERLLEIKPQIEEHFQIALADCEKIQYLIYDEGSFFTRHADDGTLPKVRGRRVSVVIFLSSPAKDPAPGFYVGGELMFHGILRGPVWGNCPLPLDSETGMLVAFRSDLEHEVKPVISGRRFTIVTWFSTPE